MESLIELAWLAGRYPGVRIGISAAVLPIRDVDWLVRQAATLDQISEGNFVLAVAAGFWADELEHRGIVPSDRGAELRARLDRLRTEFAGDRLSPEPYTPGGPPVWLAGGEATMRLAARVGLPFQASRALPQDLAPMTRRWQELGGQTFAHRIYIEWGENVPDGEQVERHALTGSPDQLFEGLESYRALGVADLSMALGHDDASALRTLEVLLDDVLPRLDGTRPRPLTRTGLWSYPTQGDHTPAAIRDEP
jgi:alkanesulfonate monooxygenase SsuD/methylene tetrahydromethanopterin reductase-like flavin-dependent oxidoreductase (luciferase family)